MATPKYIVDANNQEQGRETEALRSDDRAKFSEAHRPANPVPGSEEPGSHPIPDPESSAEKRSSNSTSGG